MKIKKLREKIIEHKIKQIEEGIAIIEENLPQNLENFLHLRLVKEGIYKKIEFMIENIVDICAIINSDLALGIPSDEEDIINKIEFNKIISKKLTEKIKEMKGFRNILVHKYGEIDDEQAFEDIKDGMKDFVSFIKEIRKFLKKNS